MRKILITLLERNQIGYEKFIKIICLIIDNLKIDNDSFEFEIEEKMKIFNFIYNHFITSVDLEKSIRGYQQRNLINLFKGIENSIINQKNWDNLKQFKNLAVFYILS